MSVVDTVESLLFVANAPVPIRSLAEATSLTEGQIEQALEVLSEKLRARSSLQIVQIAGGFQLCTRPEFADVISRFLKPQGHRLSKALMEVMAIVAYKQPITLAEIEMIRGVHSDYGVRALQERRLITEVGRRSTPGRPVLYGTTQQFLHVFNLIGLEALPEVQTDPEIQPSLEFDESMGSQDRDQSVDSTE